MDENPLDEKDWDSHQRWSEPFTKVVAISSAAVVLVCAFMLGRCSTDERQEVDVIDTVSSTSTSVFSIPVITPSTDVVSVDSTKVSDPEFIVSSTAPFTAPQGTASRMLMRVNQEREREGLQRLTWCPSLERAATGHSVDMADRQYFEHTTPDGLEVWDRAQAEGYEYQSIGENIAVGQSDVQQVMDDWMDSPGHRKNLLDPDFEHFGLGIHTGLYDGRLAIYWTQNFGAGGDCR